MFWQAPACHLPFQPSRCPDFPFSPCGRRGLGGVHRGRCFGKPLRAISRFSHQDAPTPPSPRAGKGGWGDVHRGRCFGKPLRAISRFSHQDAPTPPSPLVGEGGRGDVHRGRCFGKPLRAISRFSHQDAPTPPSPLVGEGGRGDEGQGRIGMQNIVGIQGILPSRARRRRDALASKRGCDSRCEQFLFPQGECRRLNTPNKRRNAGASPNTCPCNEVRSS
jgi:hypothetical protein